MIISDFQVTPLLGLVALYVQDVRVCRRRIYVRSITAELPRNSMLSQVELDYERVTACFK